MTVDWKPISDAPLMYHGFVFVRRDDGAVEIAYLTSNKSGALFQCPYTVGDREGLDIEYLDNVTSWAEIPMPS